MDLDLILRFAWRIVGIIGVIMVVTGKRSENDAVTLVGVLLVLAAVILLIASLNY